MKTISPQKYKALSEKEKDYWVVSRWSKYKTVITADFCDECGHVTKSRVRVPAKGAKPLRYKENPLSVTLWAKEIAKLFKHNT